MNSGDGAARGLSAINHPLKTVNFGVSNRFSSNLELSTYLPVDSRVKPLQLSDFERQVLFLLSTPPVYRMKNNDNNRRERKGRRADTDCTNWHKRRRQRGVAKLPKCTVLILPLWSAPTERSGDGAFTPRACLATLKAVSRSACHRTPHIPHTHNELGGCRGCIHGTHGMFIAHSSHAPDTLIAHSSHTHPLPRTCKSLRRSPPISSYL
jgi:hypothetical protein